MNCVKTGKDAGRRVPLVFLENDMERGHEVVPGAKSECSSPVQMEYARMQLKYTEFLTTGALKTLVVDPPEQMGQVSVSE